MINQTKALKLIKIYSIIYDRFEKDLKYTCERFSNNDKQDLTDQEIMTIYLFAVQEVQRFSIKQIYGYACDYLLDWFTRLGSYAGFSIGMSIKIESGEQTKNKEPLTVIWTKPTTLSLNVIVI